MGRSKPSFQHISTPINNKDPHTHKTFLPFWRRIGGMLLNDTDAVAQREPLIGPLLHGSIKGGLRDVDVPDRSDRQPDMERVLIPQLHAITHVGDVVQVRVSEFPQQLVHLAVEVRIGILDHAGFSAQLLQKAQGMELTVIVRGILTHGNKTRTIGADSQA